MEQKFDVEFLPEAVAFIEELSPKAREKVLYNIRKAQFSNDPELLKKLTDTIWEFRTLFNRTHYRIFAFWQKAGNKQSLVLATHGLIKKTDKTPKSDLEKAERIRQTYLKQSTNDGNKKA
jgi:phage-related protein